MPYNTRRKSVSLSSLGIHVPNSSRSSSHRSPPATAGADDTLPPTKKIKRSHSGSSDAPLSPTSLKSPSKSPPPTIKNEQAPPPQIAPGAEATPPPEPGYKIDTEGINDEIVVGVIEQLEKTGNRPHLLKELAAILQHTIPIVQSSANQPAIISSRLATYMKRPWTALAPCPLGKELIGTHPKRIYFYLLTQPRQAFPDPPERADAVARIISPSLTSAENEEEDKSRSRENMSPSPEVDLSVPELGHYESPMSATEYYPHPSHMLSHVSTHDSSNSTLAQSQASPPLEGDEREFTQTATSLQQRRKSESEVTKSESERVGDAAKAGPETADEIMADDSEESRALHNRSDAAALFGQSHHGESTHLSVGGKAALMESSPMLRPQMDFEFTASHKSDLHHDDGLVADLICETVEMDELDDLFAKY